MFKILLLLWNILKHSDRWFFTQTDSAQLKYFHNSWRSFSGAISMRCLTAPLLTGVGLRQLWAPCVVCSLRLVSVRGACRLLPLALLMKAVFLFCLGEMGWCSSHCYFYFPFFAALGAHTSFSVWILLHSEAELITGYRLLYYCI